MAIVIFVQVMKNKVIRRKQQLRALNLKFIIPLKKEITYPHYLHVEIFCSRTRYFNLSVL